MNHNALDRRNFFKASLLGGAALAMPWSASRTLAAAAEPAPNQPPLGRPLPPDWPAVSP